MSTPTQPLSPNHLLETLGAYQRTEALRAAIQLDLFTPIAEGVASAAELAHRLPASERGIRILCDYLVVIGFLTKQANRYALTLDSAMFLDKRSPAYLGGVTGFLLSPVIVDAFRDLAAVVRKGGTLMSGEGTVEPDHPVWRDFARSMAPMMAIPAEQVAELLTRGGPACKVLDIAAGHGLFGISIARKIPAAEIVAVDWKHVLEVARENAAAAGLDSRYHTLPGSAFEVEFGSGYDIVLLTNFLHHFDAATCEGILRKVHQALKAGGRCATLEFVPNPDRVTPPIAAAFSLTMLAGTAAGDAYTFAELDRMAATAGFARSEMVELPPGPQRLVISYK